MILRRPTLVVLTVLAAALACALCRAPVAAAVTCPAANPVVNENNCKGAGSTGWRIENWSGTFMFPNTRTVTRPSPVWNDIS